jgi:hypothetical protein
MIALETLTISNQTEEEMLDERGDNDDYDYNYNSVALVRKRTISTGRPPLAGEVSYNFCEQRVSHGQRNGSLRPYSRFYRPMIMIMMNQN